MKNTGFFWIIALVVFLVDYYVFQAVKVVSQPLSEKWRTIIHISYWCVSILTLTIMLLFPYLQFLQHSKLFKNYFFTILLGLFFAKLVGSLIFLTDDLRRSIPWAVSKALNNNKLALSEDGQMLSRSAFLSWIGFGLGGSLFGTLLIGFSNKYNYQVKKITLHFDNLPKAFHKFKLIHISDIHSGSLQDVAAVNKGIDLILQQQADLILFTGDLVNDRADEMNDFQAVFGRLKAPMGVFSTLGNHDYGDYVSWPSAGAKTENLERLKQVHANMGWRLLMNEHQIFEKNGEKIALMGIENWGAKGRFPKYGKMNLAYQGTESIPFKILMSHDPSHWDAEVKTKYPDIDITLSGHTHGMQFGVDNAYFKWSPVQWMYKQWAGLYEDGRQKLYVNRGFGFLGYQGRVGILPEITVLELKSKS